MNDEYPIDDLERAIRDYFANRPPADVVPIKKYPMTRNAILGLEALAAEDRIVCEVKPETLTDEMGRPIGVTDKESGEMVVATVMITRRQLEAAGLTDADVPHLTVVGE